MSYQCSECKLAVIVIKGEEPIKACSCKAPIHMNMEVALEGKGAVSS
jgi:hypothetical protein